MKIKLKRNKRRVLYFVIKRKKILKRNKRETRLDALVREIDIKVSVDRKVRVNQELNSQLETQATFACVGRVTSV